MPGIVRIVFGIALRDELMADLKENLLELRDAFAGFGLEIYGPLAEFLPEFGIGHETARLFVRKSCPFGEAAKRVIHRSVQTGEERDDLLTLALLLSSEGILRGPSLHPVRFLRPIVGHIAIQLVHFDQPVKL